MLLSLSHKQGAVRRKASSKQRHIASNVNIDQQVLNLGIKSVHIINADLKFKMEQATTVVYKSANQINTKPEIKAFVNLDKALKVKGKVSPSLSRACLLLAAIFKRCWITETMRCEKEIENSKQGAGSHDTGHLPYSSQALICTILHWELEKKKNH